MEKKIESTLMESRIDAKRPLIKKQRPYYKTVLYGVAGLGEALCEVASIPFRGSWKVIEHLADQHEKRKNHKNKN